MLANLHNLEEWAFSEMYKLICSELVTAHSSSAHHTALSQLATQAEVLHSMWTAEVDQLVKARYNCQLQVGAFLNGSYCDRPCGLGA